jgi:hypothetical protein
MSDHDNMNDDRGGEQQPAPEPGSAEDDASSGGADQDVPTQEVPNSEDEAVVQGDVQQAAQEMDHEGDQEETLDIEAQKGSAAPDDDMDEDDVHEDDIEDNDMDMNENDMDENDMNEDDEEAQQAVMETIERELEADTDMADQHQDSHNHHDATKECSTQADNTQLETNYTPEAHIHDIHEQGDDTGPMHGLQANNSEPTQVESNFQSAQVAEEQLGNDSSSLFVPEVVSTRAASHAPARPGPSLCMPPPSRPSGTPSSGARSIFGKIRSMQKANTDKKNAIKKKEEAYRHKELPDSETYLEAVMNPIRSSTSTPCPAIGVDDYDKENRLALAEFQQKKSH